MHTLTPRRVLFEQLGELSTTPKDPVRELAPDEVIDETATVMCCWHADDWRLVPVTQYAVQTMWLPAWLSVPEYLCRRVAWQWLWRQPGCDAAWPERWQRGLVGLGEAQRYAAIQLLAVRTFRSPFRASLRQQLEAWLETPAEARAYPSPFSSRQWQRLLDPRTVRAARSVAHALYHRTAYVGLPAPTAPVTPAAVA